MFDELMKAAVMKPLEQQVAELGCCPKCHIKTLRERHEAEALRWMQCEKCNHIWVLSFTANGHESSR